MHPWPQDAREPPYKNLGVRLLGPHIDNDIEVTLSVMLPRDFAKEHLKMLQEQNETLYGWIKDLRAQVTQHRESRDRAWDEVIRLRQENAALWQRLQERRSGREMSAELRLARAIGPARGPPPAGA